MGVAEEVASLLRSEFPKMVIKEPGSEDCLHSLIYQFLVLKGFDVIYTAGRARPDLVVKKPRGRIEVPVEVKFTGTASDVDRGVSKLLDYMKGSEWKTGILFVWDRSKKASAYSRAEELKRIERRGRTIIVVAVKPQT